MHRALTCHDILVQLFETISAHQTGGRHQLAQIARCCKTLSEPALDVLWKELDDLSPLLQILPACHLPVGRCIYEIHGTINDDDWHRFKHFAHRVRKLRIISMQEGNSNTIGRSVFRRLSQHFGRLPILPLLSTLITRPCDEVFLLLSSPLSCLTLLGWDDDDNSLALRAILDVLAGSNENLQHLSIECVYSALRLAVPIVQFRGLRSLTIPDVDLHDIFSISTLPHLEKLDISLGPDLVPNAEHLAEPLFRSLTDFTVSGTVEQITEIFMYVRPGTLRSVTLRVEDGLPTVTLDHWKRCLQALLSQPLQSLRSVDIDLDLGEDIELCLTQAFEPLLPLRQLQSVKLRSMGVSITDEAISKIASMWPDLTTLSLPRAHNTKATFRSLHLLATACPHLIYLGLNIDTSSLRGIEFPRQLTHGLQTWDAGKTRGSLLLLARYVHRLFPHLRCVMTSTKNDEYSLPELVSLCQGVEADAGSRPAKRSYSRIADSLSLAT